MFVNRIRLLQNIVYNGRQNLRCMCDKKQGPPPSSTDSPCSPCPAPTIPDVPGPSANVVCCPNEPVGPGVDTNKCGAYKVPEYFCYDKDSYFEAEVEMLPYRLPQPSALK